MKVPFGAVDADGHINEPETKLMEYLEGPVQRHQELP